MEQPFERIIIVMFENQYRSYVMEDAYMRKLAKAGASMDNFFGVFHPSQTNYVASLAGEVCAITNDTPPAKPLLQRNLVDLMEEAGVSWKGYMEGYPNEAWKAEWEDPNYDPKYQPVGEFPNDGKSLARYFRKHNAFASFHTIQAVQERWAKIVDEHQFWRDVHSNTLPQYSWFSPDIWNDGHYVYNTHVDTNPRTQLIPQISSWLEYVFFSNIESTKVEGGVQTGLSNIGLNLDIDLLIENPKEAWEKSNVPKGTLIVVTFDEADFDAVGYDTNYDGSNQIYTVLLGDMIAPGSTIDVPYNHYSLIKTVQKNYQLGTLNKNDKSANWIRPLWKENFSWSETKPVPVSNQKDLVLTTLDGTSHLLTLDGQGNIHEYQYAKNQWSDGSPLNVKGATQLALSAIDDTLLLVFGDASGQLGFVTSNGDGHWSAPEALAGANSFGSITMASYLDEADQKQKLMLCWQSERGFIKYLTFSDGAWATTTKDTGQLTDGSMALCQLGPSLFLVYKERNTRGMRLTSYNLAPYNAFDAVTFDDKPAPHNNTSLHEWSPADMPVGHFAQKLNTVEYDYLTLGRISLAAIEGEMHLVYRGPYDDTPTARTAYFGLTGIFTASNQLTNGHGTIDQAGWTKEQALASIQLNPDSPIGMTSDGERIMVVWQDATTGHLQLLTGGYS